MFWKQKLSELYNREFYFTVNKRTESSTPNKKSFVVQVTAIPKK